MKEQIEKIYVDAINEDLPPNVFADKVLRLFSVSGSLPTQEEVSKAFDYKIKLGNDISKWTGLPQDTPAEYALKMLWFMDGCQFVYDKVKGNDR